MNEPGGAAAAIGRCVGELPGSVGIQGEGGKTQFSGKAGKSWLMRLLKVIFSLT